MIQSAIGTQLQESTRSLTYRDVEGTGRFLRDHGGEFASATRSLSPGRLQIGSTKPAFAAQFACGTRPERVNGEAFPSQEHPGEWGRTNFSSPRQVAFVF